MPGCVASKFFRRSSDTVLPVLLYRTETLFTGRPSYAWSPGRSPVPGPSSRITCSGVITEP
ncbi:hypothetical protein C1I94_06380 [Akkermansia muciniphila]|nr:hypothetical protein C1I90_06145 [Akkermansia muciniphila]QAA41255.1 hypothetical protein C1I94_06380 [Akkermansia muciniphila]QAA48195.1 hypothetical protein C1O40_06365 [Akkermansia muciniphila]QAA68809.1 hypothetical protein C1O62_06015 [Akkermansia muciniphila]